MKMSLLVGVLSLGCWWGASAIADEELPTFDELKPGWNELKPGGDTLCARGAPFSFFVSKGTSDKVVVDFIGGGACWNGINCSKESPTFSDSTDDLRRREQEGLTGVYDHTDDRNPLKDWTHVVIPYCTGDIHWGHNDVTYKNRTGEEFVIHHRGAVNAAAVVQWVKDNFAAPKKLLSTGCSAGAYGSIYWTPALREAFPDTQFMQFADAGVGVITDSFFKNSFPNWNPIANGPTWVPGLEAANWPKLSVVDLYSNVSRKYPDIRLGQYSAAYDGVQTFFYEIMGGDGADWSGMMYQHLRDISVNDSSFRYYVAPGEDHCVIPYERMYTINSNGVSFSDWLNRYINGQAVNNVECNDCQAPQ